MHELNTYDTVIKFDVVIVNSSENNLNNSQFIRIKMDKNDEC